MRIQEGALEQYVDSPTREGAILDLVLGNEPGQVIKVSVERNHRNHRNPTVQKEAIRPIESAPTTIPHRTYPYILPTNPSNLRIPGH